MKNFLFAIILGVASFASAQTVGPLYSECGKKCSGSFQVTNNGLNPMTVTIEYHGFKMRPGADGQVAYDTVENNADVQLSSTSARLSPQQTYTFDYKVRCHEVPCTVGIAAGMIIGHTDEGMAIKLVMGHIVY